MTASSARRCPLTSAGWSTRSGCRTLTWQLWVYDLGTGERTQLAEPGNVDDQGAWLDAETVAYGKIDENSGQVNVWSVPADGTGAPRLIAENAESPAGL